MYYFRRNPWDLPLHFSTRLLCQSVKVLTLESWSVTLSLRVPREQEPHVCPWNVHVLFHRQHPLLPFAFSSVLPSFSSCCSSSLCLPLSNGFSSPSFPLSASSSSSFVFILFCIFHFVVKVPLLFSSSY